METEAPQKNGPSPGMPGTDRSPSADGEKKPSLSDEPSSKEGETQATPSATGGNVPPPGSRLYVGRIPRDMKRKELEDIFSEYGIIHDCFLLLDKGYGFIQFNNEESAKAALSGDASKRFDVKVAHDKKPRADWTAGSGRGRGGFDTRPRPLGGGGDRGPFTFGTPRRPGEGAVGGGGPHSVPEKHRDRAETEFGLERGLGGGGRERGHERERPVERLMDRPINRPGPAFNKSLENQFNRDQRFHSGDRPPQSLDREPRVRPLFDRALDDLRHGGDDPMFGNRGENIRDLPPLDRRDLRHDRDRSRDSFNRGSDGGFQDKAQLGIGLVEGGVRGMLPPADRRRGVSPGMGPGVVGLDDRRFGMDDRGGRFPQRSPHDRLGLLDRDADGPGSRDFNGPPSHHGHAGGGGGERDMRRPRAGLLDDSRPRGHGERDSRRRDRTRSRSPPTKRHHGGPHGGRGHDDDRSGRPHHHHNEPPIFGDGGRDLAPFRDSQHDRRERPGGPGAPMGPAHGFRHRDRPPSPDRMGRGPPTQGGGSGVTPISGGGGPSVRDRSSPSFPSECVVLGLSKMQQSYCEAVETEINQMGIRAEVRILNNEADLPTFLDALTKRGVLYCTVSSSQNEILRSLTVNILHGLPQGLL